MSSTRPGDAAVLADAVVEALGLATKPHESFHAGAAHAAVVAAVQAGELQLASLGKLRRGNVRTKSSARDLVTEVDVASERLIVSALRAAAPTFTIEAEEEAMDDESDAPRWIVDPLDGTVNFVHGIPMFAVSIGLYGRGEDGAAARRVPLFGIVHAPKLGETFVAASGRGAFVLSRDNPSGAERLQVSKPQGLGDAILATGFPYRRGELPNSNLENFNAVFYDVRGVRRLGAAALDLAFVAAGRLDGYWEMHLGAHDMAAGALLVLEAGGQVTDGHGGEDWLRSGHLVAADAPLAELIQTRITI